MSAPFYEERFPERVSSGAEVVVRSRTSIVTLGGGGERRNRRWSAGQLREWDAARGIKGSDDYELVRAFHMNVDGRHGGFRFKDFSDFKAEGQVVDLSAGAGAGPFQLRKIYTAGSLSKWRKIQKPVKGTTRLTLNGEPCVVLEDGQTIEEWLAQWGEAEWGVNPEILPRFTLDTTTGLLLPVSLSIDPEADDLRAGYEFDVPARFGSDELRVRAVARGRVWEYAPIPVKEFRL